MRAASATGDALAGGLTAARVSCYADVVNEIFTAPRGRPTTRAAEGLPRWRWTVAEIERLAATGFLHEDEQLELVGGEIVPISPKGRRHEIIRTRLAFHFSRSAPQGVFVASEPQFNLSDDTYAMPDILVHQAAIETPDVRGGDALLVVEVAETSLSYDLRVKAPLYASFGVHEYWVIAAANLITIVLRKSSGEGYAVAEEIAPKDLLVPLLAPPLAVRLDALIAGSRESGNTRK
jgi:Uma2 family endonuclease